MSNGGFILLHRCIDDWEYRKDVNTFSVWLRLLTMANFTEKKWNNIIIERGQCVTSLNRLAEDCGISVQKVRTALANMQKNGNITRKTTNKYSIITICNYDSYQPISNEANKQTNNPSTSKLTTTNNIINNEINNNKYNIVNSSNSDESEKLNSPDYLNFLRVLEDIELPYTMESLTEKQYLSLRAKYTDNELYNVITDIANVTTWHTFKNLYNAIEKYVEYNQIRILDEIEL